MATREDEVLEFDETPDDVTETDDGGAIVKMHDDEAVEKTYEFYDNIVEMFPEEELTVLATQLHDAVVRDKKSRERRDKEYAEAIKRTGLGKEAPGGAEFEGASRAVHPMIMESAVDYSARAIKELMPPNGPVKSYIPGENVSPERLKKADRVKEYMNWQFLKQMPEFRPELEQLLPQLALGGSQYMRITPDWSKRKTRPLPMYVPQDRVSIPYSASNFYTAERQTYHEPVTKLEFQARVKDGMYRDIMPLVNAQMPEQTEAQKATDKVEGKDDNDFYNEDGVREVWEISCWQDMEEGEDVCPYLISIDLPTKKIVAVVRNWEEDDEDDRERMQWIIEFPFIPWRGAYSVGLGQMIGSLAGSATGALRALLDSAHVNNIPTALRLKGANFMGQSKEIQATQIQEIDGGIAGDDIRKLLMPLPFNPPSPTLFQLLGFLVDAGKGVVRTTFEHLSEQNTNLPVGTTLAMIEEGMQVMSAIHLRTYHAMTMVISVLHRIDKMYLTDDEVKNDLGEVLAHRSDFQGPMDIVPTADPEVFSDVQRLAQLQIVADRADAHPDLYQRRVVEKRLLDRTKIPNPDELLIPQELPQPMNAVNENVAMSLGRPVAAFPEQDHLAHMQVLLDFLLSPNFGQLPVISSTFVPAALEHLKEHLVLWYVTENYNLLQMEIQTDESGMQLIMGEQDDATRSELDKTLAAASPQIMERSSAMFEQIPPIVQQTMQYLQTIQQPPQLPVDPNAKAETERKTADDAKKAELKGLEIQTKGQIEFGKLSAKEREQAIVTARDEAKQASDRLARLEELLLQERGQDERAAAKLTSDERRNTQDNLTALTIADAELDAGDKPNLETGTGINP